MHNKEHGGNVFKMAQEAGCAPDSLLDFSVNLRPEGTPSFILEALQNTLARVDTYPSPHAEELHFAAAKHYKLGTDCFVFGNGSNELIHALARVFAAQQDSQSSGNAYIFEPAFSEYALACRKAGLSVHALSSGVPDMHLSPTDNQGIFAHMQKQIAGILPNSLVFLANPANPSGFYLSPEACLKLMEQRSDVLWLIDEAFIEYVGSAGQCSLIARLPDNALILRSLTKFYAVAGLRIGYLVAYGGSAKRILQAIAEDLPAWTVNSLAIAAAQAVFAASQQFEEQTRQENIARREHLVCLLSELDGVEIYPSMANYVLFRCKSAPSDLPKQLLRKHRIAIRDCSNYYGLEDKTWFRAAVRLPKEHEALVAALRSILFAQAEVQSTSHTFNDFALPPLSENSAPQKLPPALMLLGTSSNAGKSILTAAFCRIFQQDGYKVAPFKSQNMSLNSGVTLAGDEMGRAQIVQAQAARIDPEARMNPILLKPHSDTGSQVIVMGKAIGHMRVAEYFSKKKELWQTVTDAYDSLAAENDVIVLEGAGSPAEINLKEHDIVNMRMAEYAKAAVLLVGDIDRGGVYASFLGTWMTFTEEEKKLLAGYIVNRFRGDASFLAPAHAHMQEQTHTPVLGVVPYIRDLGIPEEDMAGFSWNEYISTKTDADTLDIAVVMLQHVSNYTDINPLMLEGGVRVRPVRRLEDWGNPHVIIIPGSKSVVPDLEALHKSGLAQKIQEHAAEEKWIFGICGGLQILGKEIRDPHGIETTQKVAQGLNILDISSTFAADKTLVHVKKVMTPLGILARGYEIHHGLSEHGQGVMPLFVRKDNENATEEESICGYVRERCWATYVHGIFDDDSFRRAWVEHVRADVGLPALSAENVSYDLEQALDRLADMVRENVDMQAIYSSLGLSCKK